MRVLLDEQIPRDLAVALVGHATRTVGQLGWQGLENGALLTRAAGQFDALITMDKKIPADYDLTQYRLGLILIRAPSNRIESLRPLAPEILEALAKLRPGESRRVGA